jgi:hypothetical protein
MGVLLNVLATAVDGRGATYMSTPITSGRRYSAWRLKLGGRAPEPGHEEGMRREVIEHNRAHAAQVAHRLRSERGAHLIDPTRLEDLQGWTQDDYRAFWALVIERFACRVLFVDDWQYSNGCAYEFLTARRRGLPTLDERERTLSLADGAALLRSAVEEMRGQSLQTSFLECVIEELGRLPSPEVEALCTK